MASVIYISWDGDHIGRSISSARMGDNPEELRRVSNAIDTGNQRWKSWAENHGGSLVSMGGDEGQIEVSPTALTDLQQIKDQYQEAINSTVSIGIGMKLSDSFKALLCAKLRGRDRSVFYDKECEKEVEKAKKDTESEAHKIVTEYLTKAQAVHHTGDGGKPESYHVQEQSANPEIQGQQQIADMPHYEEPQNFEELFRQIASDQEGKDRAKSAVKSQDVNAVKQKVAQALQAIQTQLPQLAQIKQAAPETYTAVLGLIQGIIAIGQQLKSGDEQLAKAIGAKKRMWIGGGTRIPAMGTPERQQWDNNYKQAVANYFTDGKVHLLKPVKVPVASLEANHMVSGNEAKTRLYHRMVRAGDKMPPMVLGQRGKGYRVIDGNRRLQVALDNGLSHVEAWVPMVKNQVGLTPSNPNLPQAGMTATSDGGLTTFDLGMDKADLMPGGEADTMAPEDFDQEQLAIGTQMELEHTDDYELAREIAMDHLAEDPDYYKQEEQPKVEPLVKKIEDIPPGARLKSPVKESWGRYKHAGDRAGYETSEWVPTKSFNYSHLLDPAQTKSGYSLRVDSATDPNLTFGNERRGVLAVLLHQKRPVGNVFGLIGKGLTSHVGEPTPLQPHSELAKEHQGKGFGVKMYEALYAHAKNVEGIDTIKGGPHSEAAHRVHMSIAKKHGLNYVGVKGGTKLSNGQYPYKDYVYALKAELGPNDQLDENNLGTVQFSAKEELDPAGAPPPEKVLDKGDMPEHIQSMRAHHKLVPGQILDSRRIVVQSPSGKNVVREVSSGMQRTLDDTNSNPIGPGQGGVTSTRNKPSRV